MLSTKAHLVSSNGILVALVHILLLFSPDGTDVHEPVPFRSLGLLAVLVLEKSLASWGPSHRSVVTKVVDLAVDLFFPRSIL